jgi:hypothetical protein
MPVCDWCHTPLRGLSNTGRPRRYCDTRCRVAAFRDRDLWSVPDLVDTQLSGLMLR